MRKFRKRRGFLGKRRRRGRGRRSRSFSKRKGSTLVSRGGIRM